MAERSLIDLALSIERSAHSGQVDKAGRPYHLHPEAVASMLAGEGLKAVALLHDVIEDTEETADTLAGKGVPQHIIDTVLVLTRRDGEAYFDYIGRVAEDDSARAVKLADIRHNTDPSRPGASDAMLAKYQKAKDLLLGHNCINEQQDKASF